MIDTLIVFNIKETYACVCVPAGLSLPAIEELMNNQHPKNGNTFWKVSTLWEFMDGQPNPCMCDVSWEHGPRRQHYLLTTEPEVRVMNIDTLMELYNKEQ